jgi:hypothetical protein
VETSPLVVLLVPRHCYSSTLWTMPELVWLMMPSLPKVEVPVNSTELSMSTGKPFLLMVSLGCTVASFPLWLVLSYIVVFTLVYTTPLVREFLYPTVLTFLNHVYRARCTRRCARGLFLGLLRSWLGCHNRCWSRVIPIGHYPVRFGWHSFTPANYFIVVA